MFDMTFVPVLEEYQGYYYERKDDGTYESPRLFNYNTYDDSQFRQYSTQRQASTIVDNHSISIETTKNFPFKRGDRITLVTHPGITFHLSEFESVEDNFATFKNKLFPTDDSTSIKRLHLNKGRD